MNVGYPYRIDTSGRSASAGGDEHIRGMIEQVLFTSPGERVNRPDFGTNLRQLIFAGENDEMLTASQFLIQAALQQWLGDLIDVEGVEITSEDSTVAVFVQYRILRSQQRTIAQFKA
jgi:hypothetical protein